MRAANWRLRSALHLGLPTLGELAVGLFVGAVRGVAPLSALLLLGLMLRCVVSDT
eukprot:SAG31_NODE_19756_length_592_cov_1.097363_1_plen_55_part_00